jgi:hypothetical protein
MNNKNKNFKSRVRRKIISDTFRTWGLGMPSLVAGAINLMYSKSTANCGELRNVDMIRLKDLLLVACHVGGSGLDGVNGDG